MADILGYEMSVPAKRFRDIGDNTFAEAIALASTNPTTWDGSARDMRWAGSVTIWCYAAPATPWTIRGGDGGSNMLAQTASFNTGSGISMTSTISAVGRYTMQAGCFVDLSGGGGGTFAISGGQ